MIAIACSVVVGLAVRFAPTVAGGLQTELTAAQQRPIGRASTDWWISPWVRARLASPEVDAEIRYSPRLALRYPPSQPSTPTVPELLHTASGELRARPSRTLELLARIGFERGRVELGPLRLPQSLSGIDAATVPSVSDVQYVNAAAAVAVNVRVDRRTRWSNSLGYRFTGDLRNPGDLTSSAALPLQRKLESTTSVDYALTRRDALLAQAAASGTFVGEGWILQGQAMGGWRRALSRRWSLEGTLGLGAQTRGDPRRFVPLPVGNVAIAYDAPSHAPADARLAITALPFVDPFGTPYTRTELSLATSWSLTQAFALRSLVALGAPVGRDALRRDATGYADGGAVLLLRRGTSLTAGLRWAVQRRILGEDRPRTEWGAFVGFSYEMRADR